MHQRQGQHVREDETHKELMEGIKPFRCWRHPIVEQSRRVHFSIQLLLQLVGFGKMMRPPVFNRLSVGSHIFGLLGIQTSERPLVAAYQAKLLILSGRLARWL